MLHVGTRYDPGSRTREREITEAFNLGSSRRDRGNISRFEGFEICDIGWLKTENNFIDNSWITIWLPPYRLMVVLLSKCEMEIITQEFGKRKARNQICRHTNARIGER
jgi:hypothetical protein